MLGVARNPYLGPADEVFKVVAEEIGRAQHFEHTDVGVYFGDAGEEVPDPYFGGEGPTRTACSYCGGCMLGCRNNAKNTLDKNYLYLAEKLGLEIRADTEVTWVKPLPDGGYQVDALEGSSILPWRRRKKTWTADNVVLSGGVLGSVKLLLKLKGSPEGLPSLSARLGDCVRINSEVLIGIVSEKRDVSYSDGIAIGSIIHTDEHSHMEPSRYPPGSGFFRILSTPHSPGKNLWQRIASAARAFFRHPWKTLKAFLVPDLARSSIIMLYMRTIDGYMAMRLGRGVRTGFTRGLVTRLSEGPAPQASIPEASALADLIAEKIDGTPQSLVTETVLGIPTTAHVLGGCVMGTDAEEGVIDSSHRVFGYDGLYVIDGAAISANPGVNPSLTITAMAERAMSLVPEKL